MAARLPARLLGRQLRSQICRRSFSVTASQLDAQNFTMPALSPTMTEGNIATWKVKEGDSFQPGDILLEVETDKATMDVEAQDAGVMVKIFKSDGEKSVPVGTRIAVLGEEGDDPKSLEIPEDNSKPISKSGEAPKEEKRAPSGDEAKAIQAQKEEPSSPPRKPSASGSAPQGPGQNKKYPFYPSVIALIHENHIPESDISKIPATGPQGRLLKGDVLAYLGSIPSDYSSKQSERITHMGHLDLSNIKILEQAPPKPAAAAPETIASAPELPALTEVSLPISLSAVLATQKRIEDTIGVTIPLSTFLARATDLANTDLPRTKQSMETNQDDLFNAVLGLDVLNPKTSHGAYIPQITAFPSTSSSSVPKPKKLAAKQPDIIDILSGKTKPVTAKFRPTTTFAPSVSSSTAGAINLFSLIVPKTDEKRAKVFLERVKTVLQSEPGKLVL